MKVARNVIVSAVVLFLMVQNVPLIFSAAVPGTAVGLILSIIPSKLPACVPGIQCIDPAVVVSLVDKSGLPSASLTDTTVYLTSSLPNVANFPLGAPYPVTILAGKTYVVVNITTTATPGATTITASSTGLVSVTADLTTVEPSGFPDKLDVFVSPQTYQAGSSMKGIVRAELVDDSGLPAKAIVPVSVSLSSSNVNVTLDQNTLTISSGSLYSSGTFNSGGIAGNAIITASATGFKSGNAAVTVVKVSSCGASCAPAGVSLRVLSGSAGDLPADGLNYDVLEVGLVTSSGSPALAPSGGVTVQLSTSSPGVINFVNDLAVVSSGSESVIATVSTTPLEGTATITATSPGLLPQTVNVNTHIPAPSKLGIFVAPPSISVYPGQYLPILVVQLQDNSGNPARARQDTSIIVSPSNSTMLSSPISLSIPTGSDYAFTTLRAVGSGQSVLTASTQGMTSAQTTLTLAPNPLVISLSRIFPTNPVFFANESATMLLSVSFLGQPLNGANVTWSSTGGSMSPVKASIGASGTSESIFNPSASGSVNITSSISSPASGFVSKHYILFVNAVPIKSPPTFLQVLISLWYYIVAAVVAVIAAAFYLFRMRRRRQRAEIEAGFEVV